MHQDGVVMFGHKQRIPASPDPVIRHHHQAMWLHYCIDFLLVFYSEFAAIKQMHKICSISKNINCLAEKFRI